MAPVKQFVERDLYSVESRQTVAEVSREMARLNIGAILVLEDGRLQGLFSERDLMTRVVIEGRDADTTPVAEVMTTELVTIDEGSGVEIALERMRAHQCRHLPVLRGDEVVGLLSMRDLMNFELARKTEELHRMRAYIHGTA